MNASPRIVDDFRAAMHSVGLDYAGPVAADGKLHRFKSEGDRERNSWFVFYSGSPMAGAFGCWKRGFKETWHHGSERTLSQTEWAQIRRQWREAEAERERTEADAQAKARRTAAWIVSRAKPADMAHPYLAAKSVKTHGELLQWRGLLVLPLRDSVGALHSLQFIGPDGTKRFLRGGRVAGCCFTVADKPDGPLVICEGYATAASIHEATRLATVAALNCGNLAAVAEALRAKWPERETILAADCDQWTEGNPGLKKAGEAAKAIHARLAAPMFKSIASKPTDFNDLATLEGAGTVARQIEGATVPPETDAEAFARLAKLSPTDYDRARETESKRLAIRTATLDAEVAKIRPLSGGVGAQGFTVELPDVEPWPDAVDGAEVLSAVAGVFANYLALPPGAADALALWVTHAHTFEAFIHSPRLNLFSPEKGCGKTTALDVAASLVPRALRTESITPAVLFRLVEARKPTLLLDEVDAYLAEAEELRGLLNAGHKRGARAYRCEGDANIVRGFNAFAPAALAGIGALPGTLHDRSIVIRLVRAKPGEVAARFDSRRTAPEMELCRKLARWTADNFPALESCDPRLPEGAFNRLADNWRPLFAIAEVAGGEWPRRTAEAFANLTTGDDQQAQGIGATLLADIAAVFAAAGVDKLPSARLAESLAEFEGRPWAEFGKARKPISPNQLANQLRRFDVAPRAIRIGNETPRGYALDDFKEAFARFLQNGRFPECNTATTLENIDDNALSRVQHPENVLHPEKHEIANKDGLCCTVAPCNPPDPAKEPADALLL